MPWLGNLMKGGNPTNTANPQDDPYGCTTSDPPLPPHTAPLWGPYHDSDTEAEEDEMPIVRRHPDHDHAAHHRQSKTSTRGELTPTSSSQTKEGASGNSGSTNPNQGGRMGGGGGGGDSTSLPESPAAAGGGANAHPKTQSSSPRTIESIWEHAEAFLTTAHSHARACQWTDFVQDACSSPCQPRDLYAEFMDEFIPSPLQPPESPYYKPSRQDSNTNDAVGGKGGSLQMAETTTSMEAKGTDGSLSTARRVQKVLSQHRTHEEIEVSPDHHIQVRLPPQDLVVVDKKNDTKRKSKSAATAANNSSGSQPNKFPLETLEVRTEEAAALERSISELTMRSSYAAAHNNNNNKTDTVLKAIPEKQRRMAFYAVGKHHRQAGRGGNRRCYFTGKLILGGAPFYAGTVQQGMRTLVVFCLPSAVGLPDKDILSRYVQEKAKEKHPRNASSRPRLPSSSSRGGTIASVQPAMHDVNRAMESGSAAGSLTLDVARGLLHRSAGGGTIASRKSGASVASKSFASRASMSRFSNISSLDDLSLSIEGDLDPNWGLDRDVLLAVLPQAGPDLVKQMADTYPEQFETLPVQVRQATVWKLYVKFCFFSGLPIAEGELHYKVVDEIAEQVYGEEIALSHDVLEASTGRSSAAILTLPNRAVLQYLRKHYPQQCGKLDERVFERASWERVSPEI